MSAALALCGVVLVAGLILAAYIKREGERSWARHQEMIRRREQREAMRRMTAGFVRIQIAIRDDLTPVMQRTGAAIRRLADSLGESL